MAVVVKKKPKAPVDPYLAAAKATTEAAIAPARADIAKAIAAAETARANGSRASEGIIKAVAGMSSGDAAQERDAFQQSADRVAAYGKGLTGQMATDQQAAADQGSQLIRTLGSPGGPVVSHGADNANVTYYAGAELPADSLVARAASSLVASLDRRTATGARLADAADAGDWKAQGEIKNIRDQLVALESKRPGLIQDALNNYHQQANAKRATDTQVGYLQLQQAKTVEDQAVAMTNLTGTLHIVVGVGAKKHVVDTGRPALGSDAAVTQQRAAQAAADRRAANQRAAASNASREAAAKTAADASLAAANARIAGQKAAAEVKANAAKGGKPPTAQQKNAIIVSSVKTGNSIVSAKINQWWANTPDLAKKGPKESQDDYAKRYARGVKELNNKKAYNFLGVVNTVANTISPNLKLLGWTDAQILAQARTIVTAQIKPPPGQ